MVAFNSLFALPVLLLSLRLTNASQTNDTQINIQQFWDTYNTANTYESNDPGFLLFNNPIMNMTGFSTTGDVLMVPRSTSWSNLNNFQGLLYDRDDGCSNPPKALTIYPPPVNVSSSINQIALMRRGGCNFLLKVQTAQSDGAEGLIIYDNDDKYNNAVDPNSNYTWTYSNTNVNWTNSEFDLDNVPVNIMVFFTSAYVGKSLWLAFNNTGGQGYDTTPNYVQRWPPSQDNVTFNYDDTELPFTYGMPNYTTMYVTVLLSPQPADETPVGLGVVWAFIIKGICIVIVVIGLLTCFCMRRRVLAAARARNSLRWIPPTTTRTYGPTSQTHTYLTPEQLAAFPTRIYHTGGFPRENANSDTPLGKVLFQLTDAPEKSTRSSQPTDPNSGEASLGRYGSVCAICLEDFSEGDELRKLPCRHEYHVGCIDSWLMYKSSLCPICKYDCLLAPPVNPYQSSSNEENPFADPHSVVVNESNSKYRPMDEDNDDYFGNGEGIELKMVQPRQYIP